MPSVSHPSSSWQVRTRRGFAKTSRTHFLMPFCLPTWTSGRTHSRSSWRQRLHLAWSGTQSHLILLRRQTMQAASLVRPTSLMILEGVLAMRLQDRVPAKSLHLLSRLVLEVCFQLRISAPWPERTMDLGKWNLGLSPTPERPATNPFRG